MLFFLVFDTTIKKSWTLLDILEVFHDLCNPK